MHIECHKAKILHQWATSDGRLLSGAVLVEFSLQGQGADARPGHSKLVEYVSFQSDPKVNEARRNRYLEQRAFEQVIAYFEGEGKRENLFADGPDPAAMAMVPRRPAANTVSDLHDGEAVA